MPSLTRGWVCNLLVQVLLGLNLGYHVMVASLRYMILVTDREKTSLPATLLLRARLLRASR
jgi:hypothetical protein